MADTPFVFPADTLRAGLNSSNRSVSSGRVWQQPRVQTGGRHGVWVGSRSESTLHLPAGVFKGLHEK
jgi:hypothetical protein